MADIFTQHQSKYFLYLFLSFSCTRKCNKLGKHFAVVPHLFLHDVYVHLLQCCVMCMNNEL